VSSAGQPEPSRSELDREYSPSAVVGDIGRYLREYAEASAAARVAAGPRAAVDVAYGPGPSLDLLPPPAIPGRTWPVLVFLHGGFWQDLSKTDSAFAAPAMWSAGAGLVAPDYTLAPHADLDQIVEECRAVLVWLYQHVSSYGGDPDRIVVAGHSAGAHLAAMLLTTDWTTYGLRRHPVAAAVLIGGVYDLEPLRHTYVNEAVGMDADQARRNSPIRHPPPAQPVLASWGSRETEAFKRQSLDLVAAWGTDALEQAGRHHFDAPLELADRTSELYGRTLRLLG